MLNKNLINLIGASVFLLLSSCTLEVSPRIVDGSVSLCTTPSNIYYVKTSGSDTTGNGSIECPYASIQKAVNAIAFAGVTGEVHIAAGTYEVTEPVMVTKNVSLLGGYSDSDWNDRAYLRAADRTQTKYQTIVEYTGSLDGSIDFTSSTEGISACALGLMSGGVTNATIVEGLTINAKKTGIFVAGLCILNNADPTVQYNTINGSIGAFTSTSLAVFIGSGDIKNNEINGGTTTIEDGGTGGVIAYMSSITLTGNNITAGVSPKNAYAVYIVSSMSAEISSNYINGGTAADTSYAVNVSGTPNTVISNNRIDGGTSENDSVGIYAKDATTTLDISGNVINSGSSRIGAAKGIEVDKNASGVISGNTLSGGVARSIQCMDVHTAGIVEISDNTIEVGESTSSGTTGILINSSTSAQISSNVIRGGTGPSSTCAVSVTSTPATISLNTINGGTAATTTTGIYTYGTTAVVNITGNQINPGISTAGEARGLDMTHNSSGTVSSNIFSGGSGKSTIGIRLERTGDVNIHSNTIETANAEDTGMGISLYNAGALYGVGGSISVTSTETTNIFNNTIIGPVTTDDTSFGISVDGTSGSPLIANNTILNGHSAFGSIAILLDHGSSGIIKNNIIYSVHDGQAVSVPTKAGTAVQVMNNSFFGTDEILYYGETDTRCSTVADLQTAFPLSSPWLVSSGNVDVAPIFEDYAGKDFRLKADTPAAIRLGGLNLSASFTVDKSGALRTVSWSIGAYEKN